MSASDGVVDEGLVSRLRRGELAAIGEAYDAHARAVMGFARRLVGEESAAQDLTHEVFLTLPSAVRGFEERSSLRTFLLSIAVNHARHHVRAASRRRAVMDELGHLPENRGTTPEQEAMRVDLARELTRALDALPLEQRVAFVLCEVEELSAREAGEVAGCPEATMRTRLFHAKRKLREELEARGVR